MFFAIEARGGAAFERFAREAQLSQTLRHPSLVEVYEVSIDLGFLVMELLHGGSLAQRLAQGDRLSGQQVRRMAIELVDGLSAAHHRGIIHRDVKPANVFFDSRGTAKLGDFGVAHLVDLGQTQTGGLIGTLAYMSPEQITGAPITVAADLYCLGVTLFEALTGRLPFLGPDFVAQHLGETPVAPTEFDASIAPAWNAMLARLMMKNPSDRTPSLVELRAELETLDLVGRTLPMQNAPPAREARAREQVASDTSSSSMAAASDAAAADADAPRYQFETPVGTTPISQLVRAVDTVLQRSVILERFEATDEAALVMEQVRLLARAHTPFLQRALSFDRLSRVAVFEAPSGASIAERRPVLSAAELVRVIKRLARGIAAVHELGGWHGGIELRSVVLDEGNVPTILASGLGSAPGAAAHRDGSARKDVEAVIGVAAYILGCPPSLHDVAAALAASVETAPPVLPDAAPQDGEALYAAADLIDVAVLTALGAR
jgi:serine/threonine-protein kinase